MERSGNFYKAIRLGYILISILIGCMAYNSLYEWQEIEALELGNKKIDELRKEINNINIQMIKFSLLGETILEWNDKDIEHYHARRMAMDSMLCRFKATYPAERIDSVRSLLEDKERQMFQIVRLMDEQQSINKKIANQIPVIVQKSVQEQSKKPKRKGFLGIFGKKKEVTPAVSTTILHSVNRNVISEQKVQDRQLSEQADSLAARNAELNRHNELLTGQIEQAMAANNLNTVSQLTGQSLLSKEDENTFRKSFAAIYPLYLPKLREKYPQLTRNEELLAMLICMNQSTDEIALIMGINRSSVNMIRSRMRKKIKLTKEESLDEVIKQYLS